jgi:hypothetical protein
VVGGIDVHADRDPVRAGMQCRADRTERLGKHTGRAAVQQPVGLAVAFDRHPRDEALHVVVEELDPHSFGEIGQLVVGRRLGHTPTLRCRAWPLQTSP